MFSSAPSSVILEKDLEVGNLSAGKKKNREFAYNHLKIYLLLETQFSADYPSAAVS